MSGSNIVQPVVFLCHGLEGTPQGGKIQRLAAVARRFGCRAETPDFRGIPSGDDRAEKLIGLAPKNHPRLILVGSSMGGYQSLVASERLRPVGLFLMAPAVHMHSDAFAQAAPRPVADRRWAVHGWNDDVVAPENVIGYCQRHRFTLTLVPDGHRLQDSLDEIEILFTRFLEKSLEPPEEKA